LTDLPNIRPFFPVNDALSIGIELLLQRRIDLHLTMRVDGLKAILKHYPPLFRAQRAMAIRVIFLFQRGVDLGGFVDRKSLAILRIKFPVIVPVHDVPAEAMELFTVHDTSSFSSDRSDLRLFG
jgi:hypothetical protein